MYRAGNVCCYAQNYIKVDMLYSAVETNNTVTQKYMFELYQPACDKICCEINLEWIFLKVIIQSKAYMCSNTCVSVFSGHSVTTVYDPEAAIEECIEC